MELYGIFDDQFIVNLLMSLAVKDGILKMVSSSANNKNNIAQGEDRTHDLQITHFIWIMRLTVVKFRVM